MKLKKSHFFAPLIGIVFSLLLFIGCYEGFTGTDGGRLKEYLSPAALTQLIQTPQENIWIVDVRPAGAFAAGHIPTAKSFPSGEIFDRLAELPRDIYIILYCETGGRAQAVIDGLIKEGYTRVMNWGGVIRWPGELVTD